LVVVSRPFPAAPLAAHRTCVIMVLRPVLSACGDAALQHQKKNTRQMS
jgi:hypothetical protein